MIYQCANQMLKADPKLFKYGEQGRDYIYVKDVVRANLLAAQYLPSVDTTKNNPTNNIVLNCGGGRAVTFNDIVAILNTVLGTKRKPVYIDNPFTGNYQEYTQCKMDNARMMLNFTPQFNISAGIQDYYDSGWLVPITLVNEIKAVATNRIH